MLVSPRMIKSLKWSEGPPYKSNDIGYDQLILPAAAENVFMQYKICPHSGAVVLL